MSLLIGAPLWPERVDEPRWPIQIDQPVGHERDFLDAASLGAIPARLQFLEFPDAEMNEIRFRFAGVVEVGVFAFLDRCSGRSIRRELPEYSARRARDRCIPRRIALEGSSRLMIHVQALLQLSEQFGVMVPAFIEVPHDLPHRAWCPLWRHRSRHR